MKFNDKKFRTWFWVLPMSIAAVMAGYIYFVLPHERSVESLGMFIFKLLPFFFASIGVATFPHRVPTVLKLLLLFGTVVLFFTFFVPRQLFFLRSGLALGLETAVGSDTAPFDEIFAKFYTITAMVVPFFILSTGLGYRLGGGSAGNTLKFLFAGIVFMISGIEDIAYFVVNGLGQMPDTIYWASHMTVRLGREATRTEFFVICALHILLAVIILVLPMDKILQRLQQRLFAPTVQLAEA